MLVWHYLSYTKTSQTKCHKQFAQLAICIASAILGIISLKMGAIHTQKHKKAEKKIFKNFDLWPLWPYCLWPCGLCNLAEILHAFQVVLKTSEYKISLHLVQKCLSYNTFYISAMAFYLVTLQGHRG